jgi:hypothetical protein
MPEPTEVGKGRVAMAYENDEEVGTARTEKVLNLRTVQKMLPYVQQIVTELTDRRRLLSELHPEQGRLERKKRHLSWQERKARYSIQDEIALQDRGMQDVVDELGSLGVVVLDADEGRIGFPTMVNNRPAYFTWTPGEEGLHSWQFAEENVARPIPFAWFKETSFTGKQGS